MENYDKDTVVQYQAESLCRQKDHKQEILRWNREKIHAAGPL